MWILLNTGNSYVKLFYKETSWICDLKFRKSLLGSLFFKDTHLQIIFNWGVPCKEVKVEGVNVDGVEFLGINA